MANLVVDIGNSRTKLAVFNNREICHFETHESADRVLINRLLDQNEITGSIISSVRDDISTLEAVLIDRTRYTRFSATAQKKINLSYRTPETLGLDRLAGVIGARSLYPDRNCLSIDAGTCITYDAVDSSGEYSGGSISPGLAMRFNAMHMLTGRLPLINLDEQFYDWHGHDTVTSMLSGVQNGAFLEVKGFIEVYSSHYPDLQIILCGGDANYFDTRLKNSIFAHTFKTEPHLVLIGLNEVIYQNND
ncbi:type III pantothenate kinase [Flavihumibacter sp. R14]|nr:type III pantothenate kinase [Flavihumibacter soli]